MNDDATQVQTLLEKLKHHSFRETSTPPIASFFANRSTSVLQSRPQSVRDKDESIQKHFHYREIIVERNKSASRQLRTSHSRTKTQNIKTRDELQTVKVNLTTMLSKPDQQENDFFQEKIKLEEFLNLMLSQYNVFKPLKVRQLFTFDENFQTSRHLINKSAFYHLMDMWRNVCLFHYAKFKFEIIEKQNYMIESTGVKGIVDKLNEFNVFLYKHLIHQKLGGVATYIEHLYRILCLILDRNLTCFRQQVELGSQEKIKDQEQELIKYKELVKRYEDEIVTIRKTYSDAHAVLSYRFQSYSEERTQLVEQIAELKAKLGISFEQLLDEARDSSRTQEYFQQLNAKLGDLTQTLGKCEETMNEQQKQQESSLKSIGRITVQKHNQNLLQESNEKALNQFLKKISLSDRDKHPFTLYIQPQLIQYSQRIPEHLVKFKSGDDVTNYLSSVMDRYSSLWEQVERASHSYMLVTNLDQELSTLGLQRPLFSWTPDMPAIQNLFDFTPIMFNQFLVDQLYETHQSQEIISTSIMTITNIVTNLFDSGDIKAALFAKLMGSCNMSLDNDVQYALMYLWDTLVNHAIKPDTIIFDQAQSILKNQFPFLHDDLTFMSNIQEMSTSLLEDFSQGYLPFLQTLDRFLNRNPSSLDYIQIKLEQVFMKYDPFNLGHISYHSIISIFQKEIVKDSIVLTLQGTDLEDKIDYSKFLREVGTLVNLIRLNRVEKCLDKYAFFNLVADHLQAFKTRQMDNTLQTIKDSYSLDEQTPYHRFEQISSILGGQYLQYLPRTTTYETLIRNLQNMNSQNNVSREQMENQMITNCRNLMGLVDQHKAKFHWVFFNLYNSKAQQKSRPSLKQNSSKNLKNPSRRVSGYSNKSSISNQQIRQMRKLF